MKITHVYSDGYDNFGEYDFFFDEKKNLLTYWHCNDANYRSEYMDSLVESLGNTIEHKAFEKAGKVLREKIFKEMDECGLL